jgi:hypothetical protein
MSGKINEYEQDEQAYYQDLEDKWSWEEAMEDAMKMDEMTFSLYNLKAMMKKLGMSFDLTNGQRLVKSIYYARFRKN